jgi:hypothetical protein
MMDTARYTKAWLKISEARKALKKQYETADRALSDQQDVIGGAMLGFLNDTNQDSSTSVGVGTFKRKLDLMPSAEDWPTIYAWVKENDGWELLHKRLGKTFVEKYAEDHEGALPPGVKVHREYVLHVAPARAA